MTEADRAWLFRQLRQSLARLAADGDTALAGLPDGCCKPDELALDFHYAREAVMGNFAADLPTELVAALEAVDSVFTAVHGDGWSEEAVRSAAEWAVIRERATHALRWLKEWRPDEHAT